MASPLSFPLSLPSLQGVTSIHHLVGELLGPYSRHCLGDRYGDVQQNSRAMSIGLMSSPVVSPSAGALLSGWRFVKYVPCATCQFYSWPSCIVSRTVDPLRGPFLGQRTLYSLPQGSDCCWTRRLCGARRNTSGVCIGCSLPRTPAATSFAS